MTGNTGSNDGAVAVLSLERLNEVTFGDSDFEREICAEYLRSTDTLVKRMDAALVVGDVKTLKADAHQCKGGSMMIGADEMGAMCRELEELAEAGRLAPTAALRARLMKAYARVEDALRRHAGERAA